ncbi:MAG: hypothetical protein M0042_12685 [Nitrospiraceae bacterium]|nr:hypothetical protein [Nitrospiraceae bacterium]
MNEQRRNLKKRLFISSIIVLLIGIACDIPIYITAPDEDEDGAYEIVGGKIYPAGQEKSKRYIHDLERYGGKAAVLADEMNRWFESLWYGKNLAFTILVLCGITSLILYIIAKHGIKGG